MSKTGILIIHGFAGNREEMRPLYHFLTDKGYTVSLPLLTGHEGTKKDLASVNYKDWITAVEFAYLELSKKCEEVVIIGFSMGGLLAANLWHYKIAGLITVNTPIYYWNAAVIAKNLICDFPLYSHKYFTVGSNKPVSSLVEFQKLLSYTKPMFENIRCRTLVIQTRDDDTVHHKSADFIYKKICANKSIVKIPEGGHMVFQSESCYLVCDTIGQFISRHHAILTPQAIVRNQHRLAYANHPWVTN